MNPIVKVFNEFGRMMLDRHCQGGAEIDAATEKNPERDVADQTPPNSLGQKAGQFLAQSGLIRIGQALIRFELEAPICRGRDGARFNVIDERGAARQLMGTAIQGVRRRNVAIGEQLLERALIKILVERRVAAERAQLAGESEKILPLAVIERLLAEPVAREEQTSAEAIEYGEGKHAV